MPSMSILSGMHQQNKHVIATIHACSCDILINKPSKPDRKAKLQMEALQQLMFVCFLMLLHLSL